MRIRLASAAAALAFALSSQGVGAQVCDLAAGERVFKRCKGCHRVEPERSGVGPTLHGVVGGRIAGVPHYEYSEAMRSYAEATGVWSAERLDAYLADPRGIVPGTSMAFAGVPKAGDREALICYLDAIR